MTARSARTASTTAPSRRSGSPRRAVSASTSTATLFDTAEPERVARFFDTVTEMGIDGITVSPGYAYERAPDQAHFLSRRRTKELFRDIFRRDPKRRWSFNQSSLFLDFLAGNQTYHCTPWGNPTRNYFGWQRPCYLLGEGYAKTFKELMEETDWDSYGTGNYEKCAQCMVHSGYEATAVVDSVHHPMKAAASRCAGCAPRARWRRRSRRPPAPGRIRVRAMSRRRWRGSGAAKARGRRRRLKLSLLLSFPRKREASRCCSRAVALGSRLRGDDEKAHCGSVPLGAGLQPADRGIQDEPCPSAASHCLASRMLAS